MLLGVESSSVAVSVSVPAWRSIARSCTSNSSWRCDSWTGLLRTRVRAVDCGGEGGHSAPVEAVWAIGVSYVQSDLRAGVEIDVVPDGPRWGSSTPV